MASYHAKFGAEKHHFKKNGPITRAFGAQEFEKNKNRRGSKRASNKSDIIARWATPQRPWVVLAPRMKKVLQPAGSVTTPVAPAGKTCAYFIVLGGCPQAGVFRRNGHRGRGARG